MKKILIFALLFFPVLTFAAECPKDKVCLDNPIPSVTNPQQLMGTIINGVLTILGSLTLFMLVWGGFQWLTSAGNAEKVDKGSKTMIWAVIGVVLVLSAYILVNTLTGVLTK